LTAAWKLRAFKFINTPFHKSKTFSGQSMTMNVIIALLVLEDLAGPVPGASPGF
jgi:hypothetical protein